MRRVSRASEDEGGDLPRDRGWRIADAIPNNKRTSRLRYHLAESGPIMDAFQAWLTRQFEDRLVEPNSGLGYAIAF